MTKKYIYSSVVFLALFSANCQDFGTVLVYSGIGCNMAFGEIGSRNFNTPAGMAKPGYKFDIFLIEYQFENGFGVGVKNTASIHNVDNEKIEEFLIDGGAVQADVDMEPWIYAEFTFQGYRTLFQRYNKLLVLTLGIGQAFVTKPAEYYSVTYLEGSEQTYWATDNNISTIVGNTGLSYWIKIGKRFCLVSTIDYSHIPFRASFSTITENARNILTDNSKSAPLQTQLTDQSFKRPFTIYGLSAGIKFGLSF